MKEGKKKKNGTDVVKLARDITDHEETFESQIS